MEYNKAVSDLHIGDQVEGYYALGNIQLKKSAAGKPYLSCTVSDATGSVDAKLWNFTGQASAEDSGKAALIRGEVTEYNGNLQFIIQRMRFAGDQDDYDPAALVPAAPIDPTAAMDEVRQLIRSLEDEDYRRLCLALTDRYEAALTRLPAAKSMHHAFLYGLLMHTLNMLRLADFMAGLYAEVVHRDLLLAGTLLHDLGKLWEFRLSPLGLVTEYSVPGDLLGHIYMGAREVEAAGKELGLPEEKLTLLAHMILSHHGDPEFGAAVPPKCAEAELLSAIDRIDSRMEIYAESLPQAQPGRFTLRVPALEKRVYRID
jgi:Predicted HD-superfamily hydrolase